MRAPLYLIYRVEAKSSSVLRRRARPRTLKLTTPGTHVSVVNSYAAASEKTPVNFVNSVDFPTDGNPTNPTRQSPVFVTSKPSPLGPPFGPASSTSSRCSFHNRARSEPMCELVALFTCVRLISSSIAAILSMMAPSLMVRSFIRLESHARARAAAR